MTNNEVFGQFQWVQEGDNVVRTLESGAYWNAARRIGDNLEWRVAGTDEWSLSPFSPTSFWEVGAREALDHFFPLESTTAAAPTTTPPMATSPTATWSFKAEREKIDIPRILREGDAAGLREIQVVIGSDKPIWFVSVEVLPLCIDFGPLFTVVTNPVCVNTGWTQISKPVLARARARASKAKAEMRRVQVSGVK